MKFRELKAAIAELSEEQLDMPVLTCRIFGEFLREVDDTCLISEGPLAEPYFDSENDENQPVLILS